MQQREKILLAALLGVLAFFWVVLPGIENVLLAPFASRYDRIETLENEVARKQKEENRYLAAKRELQEWAAESLPPQPLDAQRVYAEWLVDLARLSGLRNVQPRLGSRTPLGRIYTAVTVTLTAEATLQELATFLFHFDRTRLLHRLSQCDVVSPETEGNPLLKVTLTAEGLSLPQAENRPRLFPRTQLAQPLDARQTELRVESPEAFPERGPFRIRIDREFLLVTPIAAGSWRVERGASGTTAERHDAGAIVELAPERQPLDPQAPQSVAEYRQLLEQGPFTKPRPPVVYRPQLAAIPNQTLIRGTPLTVQARLTGWDPADGPPIFLLSEDAPPGMQVDDDGRIIWSPGNDVPAGDYPVTLAVTSALNEDHYLSASFRVTLRDRNLPPQLTPPAQLPTAWIGRIWTAKVTAVDPDESGKLSYRLTGQPPAGATIDPQSGVLRWEVPETVEPGQVSLTVEVSDGGSPPQTASATLTVTVEDDAAQFTYLVGCIRDGDRWTAWLYDRSTNRSLYLQPGAEFTVADIAGKVVAIDLRSMEFEDQEGRWRLEHERPLRQAELVAVAAGDETGAAVHPDRPPSPSPPTRGTPPESD